MIHIDPSMAQDAFDYLSAPTAILERDTGVFVFGREDKLLAQKAHELYMRHNSKFTLFTGGIGKDSGNLHTSEAQFLSSTAQQYGIPRNDIILEEKATNGGENAKFGLQAILDAGQNPDSLVVVAHATSLRRLYAGLDHEVKQAYSKGSLRNIPVIGHVPTNYTRLFDAEDYLDASEALVEIGNMVTYAKAGFISDLNVKDEKGMRTIVDFALKHSAELKESRAKFLRQLE
jgi:hypothetical protein